MHKDFFITILAAGKGTRMNSEVPKVLHTLNNQAMINYVLETAFMLNPKKIFPIVGFKKDKVINHINELGYLNNNILEYVEQKEQLGTGHAVLQLESKLANREGHLLVLSGDVPNIRYESLLPIINNHIENNIDGTIITTIVEDSNGYGRILRNKSGELIKMIEHKDCNDEEKLIKEINSGIYIFKISNLFKNLKKIRSNNSSNEYYLTDVIELINKTGLVVTKKIDNYKEVLGINNIEQLKTFQK
tara:strand:+ start:116 stop:853 length:738 start_codon:yes stop_codon:yes gene_type:complete